LGYATFNYAYTDTLLITVFYPGYVFASVDTIIYTTATKSDTIHGYNVISNNTCWIYSYVRDNKGNPIEGAKLSVTLVGGNISDTCVGTVVVKRYSEVFSDATGLVSTDIIKSKCLKNAKRYEIQIEYDGEIRNKYQGDIPDASTWDIWGN
jgi:hypothetical protein